MVPGKDQIVLHASTGFKDALGKYAGANKTSMAEVIREAVAEKIGYTLTNDPPRSRIPKYATKEEQTRANLDRAALMRWGNGTASKLMVAGEIEAASLIARAVVAKDYDTLALLKRASGGDQDATADIMDMLTEEETDEAE